MDNFGALPLSLRAILRQEWVADAACRPAAQPASSSPAAWTASFYPGRGDSARLDAPRAVCNRCPVASSCLVFALLNGEKLGVWGGLSERQRRTLRRLMGIRVHTGRMPTWPFPTLARIPPVPLIGASVPARRPGRRPAALRCRTGTQLPLDATTAA